MAKKKREDARDRFSLEHLDRIDFVRPDGTRGHSDRLMAEDTALLTAEATRNAVDYEKDFYAWTVEQARLLRAGELSALDVANIAEEIESLGRSDRRELGSRLTVLLLHLLKWRSQPDMRSKSWLTTIREQRRQIEKLLRESPSLSPFVATALTESYSDARDDAVEETGFAEAELPAECPFTLDEALSRSFLPQP
jgi:hypothetical protein